MLNTFCIVQERNSFVDVLPRKIGYSIPLHESGTIPKPDPVSLGILNIMLPIIVLIQIDIFFHQLVLVEVMKIPLFV